MSKAHRPGEGELKMIVWLASFPRSGNTFLRLLLHHLYGVSTHDIYVDLPDPIDRSNKQDLSTLVGYKPISSLEALAKSDSIAFVKTHELSRDDHPAIYVIRDGRDSLTSYAHFILSQDAPCDATLYANKFLQTLRHITYYNDNFGGWSRNVTSWAHRKGPTAIIRYEDLVADPLTTLDQALTSLDLELRPLSEEMTLSFEDLKQISPQFFRKGKVGSHREEMPPHLEALYWKYHGRVMTEFGYSRFSDTKAA